MSQISVWTAVRELARSLVFTSILKVNPSNNSESSDLMSCYSGHWCMKSPKIGKTISSFVSHLWFPSLKGTKKLSGCWRLLRQRWSVCWLVRLIKPRENIITDTFLSSCWLGVFLDVFKCLEGDSKPLIGWMWSVFWSAEKQPKTWFDLSWLQTELYRGREWTETSHLYVGSW